MRLLPTTSVPEYIHQVNADDELQLKCIVIKERDSRTMSMNAVSADDGPEDVSRTTAFAKQRPADHRDAPSQNACKSIPFTVMLCSDH